MTVRPVHVWPRDSLRAVAEPVADVKDADTVQLVTDLRETVKAYRAHGLAATQIGATKRIIIVQDEEIQRVLINPEYTVKSVVRVKSFEGCLSFPGVRVSVARPECVDITYLDEDGFPHQWTPTGLSAVAVQHEMDHLDGVVMIDYLSRLEKSMALRRLKKVKKRMGSYAI